MGKYYGNQMKSKTKGEVSSGNSFAGLPQEKVQKSYPKSNYGAQEYYPDNLYEIDKINKSCHSKMMSKKK